MPRGRPKGSKKYDPRSVAVRVFEAVKSQQHTLHLSWATGKLLRGEHSLKVAVASVVRELGCSPTTVWNAWSEFTPLNYALTLEKCQSDYELDMSYQFRHDEALESLQREFGNRADFSNEEIEDRAQELDESHYPEDY
jgi:hypothetical protein